MEKIKLILSLIIEYFYLGLAALEGRICELSSTTVRTSPTLSKSSDENMEKV